LGLPNADKSLHDGRLLIDIARRAEALGFATVGTIGRVSYPSFEELVTLAAAAGATERIGLMTDILLAATREPVLLAKQAATLDQVSGGRFVLGIGVGGRSDDFDVTGLNLHDRGKRLDAALDPMHRAWPGEPVPRSPRPGPARAGEVAAEAESNLKAYYGDFGARVWEGTIKTAEEAWQRVSTFEQAGADELIMFMAAPAIEQAERLAKAVF